MWNHLFLHPSTLFLQLIIPLTGADISSGTCMSIYPWSSWVLSQQCKKLYTMPLIPEYWNGSHLEEFRRFENVKEHAVAVLSAVSKTSKIYLMIHHSFSFSWLSKIKQGVHTFNLIRWFLSGKKYNRLGTNPIWNWTHWIHFLGHWENIKWKNQRKDIVWL